MFFLNRVLLPVRTQNGLSEKPCDAVGLLCLRAWTSLSQCTECTVWVQIQMQPYTGSFLDFSGYMGQGAESSPFCQRSYLDMVTLIFLFLFFCAFCQDPVFPFCHLASIIPNPKLQLWKVFHFFYWTLYWLAVSDQLYVTWLLHAFFVPRVLSKVRRWRKFDISPSWFTWILIFTQ